MVSNTLSPSDPSSFSRPDLAVIINIFLSLSVNFEQRIFAGNVELTVQKVDKNVKELVLDVKDLNIQEIIESRLNKKLPYTISEPVTNFGSKLSIELPETDSDDYILNIRYQTSPNASGLQWLTPEQTAGKVYPFVFSQFQAIHARSFLPCQDTPSVKSKYSATITIPNELTIVMSAICEAKKVMPRGTLYHFKQDVPIPSYLIALAIGELESREIGPRSKVWAEKELIDAAEYEFANTEKQLSVAEEICGPYVWGRYDLLVLPPSFPFGGMENPCLTFVTPTLLAGDRSLANVVAHEIAHSWTGNLITNKNFEHFWLNEGFTVFIERKIVGRLEGPQSQDFQAYSGLSDLKETVKRLGENSPLTKLVLNLKNVHPDDSFSEIPYEKGHTFLKYLENVVGGPSQFEPFLRDYFNTYKYKSISTDDFKSYFENYFATNPDIPTIDWQKWLYGTGLPPVIPKYDMTMHKVCENFKQKFINWSTEQPIPFTSENVTSLLPQQVIQLLQEILDADPQPVDKLKALERVFRFDTIQNSEIKFRWLRICLKAHWEEKVQPTLDWVTKVGRMKFVRPLYRDLYSWDESRQRALDTYNVNKKNMMHVTAYTVAKDFNL